MDFFDLETPKERRERIMREAEARQQVEDAAAAEAKVLFDAKTLRANASAMVGEYRSAGVWPPAEYLDEHGMPKLSLGLLKYAGWTVEVVGDQPTLIRPEVRPKRKAKKRSEVERDST